MKRILVVVVALLAGARTLTAQTPTPPATPDRLARALKLFPDADTNRDGKLSISEAQAFSATHPELKALLDAKAANSGGADDSGQRSSSKPASFAAGAEGTRVFVCAHSYMIFTADTLPPIAKSAGVSHLMAGQQMIGGSRVVQHWNLPDEKNQAKKALRESIVDVLLLSPHLLLPDEGIDNYTKLGLEKNPKLRVLVQSSWEPRDGKRDKAFKNEMRDGLKAEDVRRMRDNHNGGWLKQLEAQVNALNASAGQRAVHIVPVSAAVFALRERVAEGQAPGLTKQSEMFRDDHGHPSEVTSLLATYCHFSAIYQRSPVGLPVPAQLMGYPRAEELNMLLQQLAWDAVSNYPLSGVKAAAVKQP